MSSIEYQIKDVESILQVDGQVKNALITRLSPPGENYLSVVLRVDAEVENNGASEKKSVVAKCIPPGERKFAVLNVLSMKNEIKWYIEIVPILKAFPEEYGVPGDIFPKYYGSRINFESLDDEPDLNCVLLLENLNPQGYDNDDRHIGCDLTTSKAILKTLALFHAIPLGLKFNRPEKFKILRDYIDSCKFPDVDFPKPSHQNDSSPPASPENALIEAINNIPECAPYVSKLTPFLSKTIGPSDWNKIGTEPWSTITHNDAWVNNIMIKHQENGEEPLVKLVDFQMCGYKSFASDVVFFLFTSVINAVLSENFDNLVRYYYDVFTNFLKTFKVDLPLPYDEYLKELKEAAISSEITHSLIFSTIVFGEKGTGVDIAVEEFNPMFHLTRMIQNMKEGQKQKITLIAAESAKRNWI